MSHAFVDAQIQSHIEAIVAVGIGTEESDKRIKSMLASFTEPGISRVLGRTENGQIVLRRANMVCITTW